MPARRRGLPTTPGCTAAACRCSITEIHTPGSDVRTLRTYAQPHLSVNLSLFFSETVVSLVSLPYTPVLMALKHDCVCVLVELRYFNNLHYSYLHFLSLSMLTSSRFRLAAAPDPNVMTTGRLI